MLALLLLPLLLWWAQAWALQEITVAAGGETTTVAVFRGTVGDGLRQAGIELHPADRVSPDPETPLAAGMAVTVERAFPVELHVDGERHTTATLADMVGEFLAEAGVSLDALDRVSPGPGEPLEPDTAVRVTRIRQEVVAEREMVPYETWRWAEPEWEAGREGLLREGRPGEEERTYLITYADGEVVDRQHLETRTVTEPRAEIIGVGTKVAVRSKETAAGTIRYTDVKEMVATAYYPGPESTGRFADGYTATGVRAGFGVVAVDPRVIPLGTRLYIPGYGIALAADVGSAIQGYRIDLCFDTYREAVQFGRRTVEVYVLED